MLQRGKVVTIKTLLKQWSSITNTIPATISRMARNITNPDYQPYGMGAVLLRTMGPGKKAHPLALDPASPPPSIRPQAQREEQVLARTANITSKLEGLSTRLNLRSSGETVSLSMAHTSQLYTHLQFSIYTLATNGTPHFANQTLTIEPRYVRDVCWWNNGIAGPAVLTYPHPSSWMLCGPDATLESVTVKHLTLAYRLPKQITPTCMQYWVNLLGYIDWGKIGSKYREKLLTPKDFMSHFKNILHRALFTRNKCKLRTATGAILCRLCHKETEHIGSRTSS